MPVAFLTVKNDGPIFNRQKRACDRACVLPACGDFGHARPRAEVVEEKKELPMMDLSWKKIIIILVVAVYVMVPDLFPGPIDDVIVSGLGLAMASKVK
jgi:hypothetical protein